MLTPESANVTFFTTLFGINAGISIIFKGWAIAFLKIKKTFPNNQVFTQFFLSKKTQEKLSVFSIQGHFNKPQQTYYQRCNFIYMNVKDPANVFKQKNIFSTHGSNKSEEPFLTSN
jgi:hypothetical protein